MKQYELSEAALNKFKNKTRKVIRQDITEMLCLKENLSKKDLIKIYMFIKSFLNEPEKN
jgi:hypothetical protein